MFNCLIISQLDIKKIDKIILKSFYYHDFCHMNKILNNNAPYIEYERINRIILTNKEF